ncbi:MAG: hypothetical protein V5A66_00245 [Candidatus Thermoplasmatota archaeon]
MTKKHRVANLMVAVLEKREGLSTKAGIPILFIPIFSFYVLLRGDEE